MTQINAINSSPIKPAAVSFGQTKTVAAMEMASDWVEAIDEKGLSEDSFNELKSFTGNMADGPLKTTATIFAIAGTAGLALKKGGAKLLGSMRKNKAVSQKVLTPLAENVKKGLGKFEATLGEKVEKLKGEKGIKAYITKNMKKGIEWIKQSGERGIETKLEEMQARLTSIEESTVKSLVASSGKKGQKLTGKKLAAAVEAKLSGKSQIAEEYKTLKKSVELAPTNNLIDKAVGNTLGAGAAVTATVETAKDKDKNGIPDIAERKFKAEKEYDYED